ncbi:nitroreductase [Nocardioides baekrokdamisoli]|uniref:Nitroreductase n=1 Tax=Nocardioides baekrokdamisoli TaxID=1804624 RepID=A0A3G9IY15_9ACTN|nr:nitroreductase family protein [Nocardioides baekrokdamisoli]BBH16188.1 nitroreductase [Nocardioides baekrokdamisoli]
MSTDFAALSRLLDERWTCRAFAPTPVPRVEIERLLALAQRTPSWCNTQPWEVIVTSGEETGRLREALGAYVMSQPQASDFEFPTAFPGAYGDRRRECGFQLYDSLGIEKSDADGRFRQMLRNFEFFDAPHVALITVEADLGPYALLDTGIYVSSLLLGAQALGLAAAPQAALAGYADFFRAHFGLPENRRVAVGMSLGYAAVEEPVNGFRTTRADLADVVAWHGSWA